MVEGEKQNSAADLVTQVVHPVNADRKRDLLVHLIKDGDWQQVLVFTKTKHGADRLALQLARSDVAADAIHGNRSQPQRTRTLDEFKRGNLRVLVATDIAARGLDIEELPHVVNYELPHVPEDYVHRIGRTGRAGSTGDAVSLVSLGRAGPARRDRARAETPRGAENGGRIRADGVARVGAARRSAEFPSEQWRAARPVTGQRLQRPQRAAAPRKRTALRQRIAWCKWIAWR